MLIIRSLWIYSVIGFRERNVISFDMKPLKSETRDGVEVNTLVLNSLCDGVIAF